MKILIVDDEILARERLVSLLSELNTDYSISEAENGVAALRSISEISPELILLDIRMPGMNGLEVAQHLTGLDTPPAIIFTTAYQDYALDAFDAHAVDYLMKPVRKERLQQAINRAKALSKSNINELMHNHDASNSRTHLSTTVLGDLQIIPIEKIYFLKADQKYVTAVWSEGEILIDDSLKLLEREFASRFIRIHRNALVALEYIQGLDKDEEGNLRINLQGTQTQLPVSRRHASHVRKILKHL